MFVRNNFVRHLAVMATSLMLTGVAFSANAAIITTTFAGGNGERGNMFDIDVLNSGVNLTQFDIHTDDTGNQNVEIYTRSGTYVGNTNSSAGWTQRFSGTVNGIGPNTVVDFADFFLSGGAYGVYVVVNDLNNELDYTDGTSVGSVFVTDGILNIREGIGVAINVPAPFDLDDTFSPRVWNGSIHYTTAAPIPEPGTLALFGLGLAGLGFARRRKAS